MAGDHVGLSRTELNREIRWKLRKAPAGAEALLPFIGELIVTAIEANNAAIAKSLGGDGDAGPDEEF